ncbi:Retrovirus-related Pol polyprotein from type-1 retrotransposable element R1 4 [Eumeta japonica]|uniref:Retrovirus-related Pol polyprotein from type-1 retrotransposable element R1 4 n=1 Tax=Eumeta variegata TaxID=151549 RepID=A0A4C1Z096_EUMVA|nr:Retrovirus-related Pol polyprotein from type-1 retrotransposable element R1 4 [Eumeta japonica]
MEMNGRELYRYFPEVSGRLQADWVNLDFQTSQILKRHGFFRKRLSELHPCEVKMCIMWYGNALSDDLRNRQEDDLEVLGVDLVHYMELDAFAGGF